METSKIKDLKIGEYFKLHADSKTVFVRGEYDRGGRIYSASKFDDHCSERFFRGDKVVHIGFDF